MQFSIAHNAADKFVDFIGDPDDALRQELGDKFVDEISEADGWPGYVSDMLHLWLLSGLGHRACLDDPVAYLGAVALVYAEFAVNPALSEGCKPLPAMPESLVTEAMGEEATFVSSPEFLIPVALTPAGLELTRLPSKKARRDAIRAFVEHPEWTRYGFHAHRYFPPYFTGK